MKMRGGLKTGSILYLSCLVLLQTGCAADLNGFQKSKTYELGQEPKVSDFTDGNGHFDLTFDGIGSYQTSIVEENGRKIPVTVIIRDTKAPEWDYFEETVTTEQGKKPSYHFSATDAGKVTIQIDDDQLDIQTPGEYECSVSAEDEAGNKIIRPFTVKVVPKTRCRKWSSAMSRMRLRKRSLTGSLKSSIHPVKTELLLSKSIFRRKTGM